MRKNSICAVLTLSESSSSLQPVIQHRPIAALPFASRFRVIDFALSNLSQARVASVALFIGRSGKSIYDHIRSGRPWGFDAHIHGGVFTFSKQFYKYAAAIESGFSIGFYENVLEFVNRSYADYVFVAGSKVLANVDVNALRDQHIKSGAALTKVVSEDDKSMNMYLLDKQTFLRVVNRAVEENVFLETDDLMRNYLDILDTNTYKHQGYVASIDNIRSYYEANMDMLKREKFESLFIDKQQILTKNRNGAPTYYSDASRVKNSLFATDCFVRGNVEDSVIFRRVQIGEGAKVKKSIIMQGGTIEDGATVEYAILDKGVTVKAGAVIQGSADNIIVIAANRVIDDVEEK